ncbi:hypothetical protein V8B55DRAFT_1326514 [Mucor lusitanicus]|uniref:Reverse transcriptase domain-containing protein n=1 Tax=Mucor lusitanicus CBS 277.49 TaxID=747725 RepID=A0A168P9U1_MUCCL|nr:hypothetical protein MUCCIDRAFT_104333 [Mucor lusitanicus CBS 277.49]
MTVVYFPASRSDRSARFLSSILTDYASVFSSSPSRSIILGDFHHTYFNASSYRNRQALAPWLEYLDDHFVNGITAPGANPSITSRRASVGCIRLRMRRLLRLLAKFPSPLSSNAPPAAKTVAYADDIVCLLSSPADLDRLHSHLQVYSAASNAPSGLSHSFCFRKHQAQQILCQAASLHCLHFRSHIRPLPPSKIASGDHRQAEPGQTFLAVSQTGSNPTRSLLSFIEDLQVWVVFLSHPSRISVWWMHHHLSKLFSLLCHLHLETVSIAFPLNRTDDFARCHPSTLHPYHLSLSSRSFHF